MGLVSDTLIPHEHLIGLRPSAASQGAVLAMASFERTSISGALWPEFV